MTKASKKKAARRPPQEGDHQESAQEAYQGRETRCRAGGQGAAPGARAAADPRRQARRPHHVRRQGPEHQVPTHHGAAAPGGRAQRADRADRRRRLRRVLGLRRPVPHAGRRAAGRGRGEAQPLPHHRAVLADPPGDADRPQPPFGRHGRDHRDGHVGAGQQQHPAQGEGADRRNPEAQRVFDRAVRQVPRGAGVGGLPCRARSTSGRPVRASSTSTASSAARPTSTTPGCIEGTTAVEPPKSPEEGYTLTEDLADRAITWVRQQKALVPDKPFFMYFAPGATHAPHQVSKEWSDKYKGKFDDGWDVLREKTLKQAEEARRGPEGRRTHQARTTRSRPGTTCPTNSSRCWPARWRSTPASSSRPTTRSAASSTPSTTSAFLDDTLIYYIIGDNGASAEGTLNGCFNEMTTLNGMPGIETTEFLLSKIDDFGTPDAYNHYAVGWAHGLCAPYQWTKQVASHWGGTRNGTIVHWPKGLAAQGRSPQPVPPRHRRRADHPRGGGPARAAVGERHRAGAAGGGQHAGVRCATARRPRRHDVQYFEMFGNRGIYHQGWTAVTKHRTPWKADTPPPFDDDVWELYGPDDWTQAHDLAAENPEKLAELQRLWLIEAVEVQRRPTRRPRLRADQPRHRRAARS